MLRTHCTTAFTWVPLHKVSQSIGLAWLAETWSRVVERENEGQDGTLHRGWGWLGKKYGWTRDGWVCYNAVIYYKNVLCEGWQCVRLWVVCEGMGTLYIGGGCLIARGG